MQRCNNARRVQYLFEALLQYRWQRELSTGWPWRWFLHLNRTGRWLHSPRSHPGVTLGHKIGRAWCTQRRCLCVKRGWNVLLAHFQPWLGHTGATSSSACNPCPAGSFSSDAGKVGPSDSVLNSQITFIGFPLWCVACLLLNWLDVGSISNLPGFVQSVLLSIYNGLSSRVWIYSLIDPSWLYKVILGWIYGRYIITYIPWSLEQ